MADPAEINIVADRRVIKSEHFSFLDQNWTGSTFKGQLRLVRDTTGTPLLTFTSGSGIVLDYAGTATVSAHVSAGRLTGVGEGNIYTLINPTTGNLYQSSDNLTLSWLLLGFGPGDLGTVPFPEERGDDAVVYYDVIRTLPDASTELIMRGTFTVRAGVTIP
jgi:hypothetical protein